MSKHLLHNATLREVSEAFAKEHPELDLNNPEVGFNNLSEEEKTAAAKQHNKVWREFLRERAPHIYNQEKAQAAITLLASNQRRKSSEVATQIIHEEYRIYSLRNDKNPEMWVYHKGVYVPNAEGFIEERVRSIYDEAYTTTLCNEVIAKVRADTYIDPKEFFDAEPVEKVCVANGILNLLTGQLEEHTPSQIHFTKIPIDYEKKAICPNIQKHLKTVIRHDEDLPVIQEIFGWMLWKEYRPEKAIMLLGSGRNGKGKTIDLMKRFLGPENVAGVPLQDLDARPFSIAELHKKLANIGADLPKNALAETGRFKNLTGGDYVTADRKHQSMLHFTNYAKMVYAANKLPVTYDITHAFFARWIIIDFPYKFYAKEEYDKLAEEEKEFAKIRDVDIIDKIATDDELSGLLNWAVEGLQRLRSDSGFSYSKNTKEVTEMWIRRSDSFAAFCMDNIEEEWNGTIEKADLRRVYSRYCRENKIEMVSDRSIKRYLAETYGASEERPTRNGSQVHAWTGIIFSQGSQDSQGFSTYREIRNNAIGVNRLTNLTKLTNDTTSSVREIDQTLNIEELVRDISALPSDNESFLRRKYGDERIDHWIKYGDIFNSRPGTLKVMK